jgi:inhibitor of KinA sporulation pathway (predicted exonuclease)
VNFPHDICIIDLEINQILQPDGSHQDGSLIELGAVWYRRDHVIADTYQSAIMPEEPLSEYIQTLCPHIDGHTRMSFTEVLMAFDNWCDEQNRSFVIGAWGNDHTYLMKYFKTREIWVSSKLYRALTRGVNIRTYMDMANVIYNKKPLKRGLIGMLNCWGLEFDGTQHQATVDALNTAYLLDAVINHRDKIQALIGGSK